MPFLANTVYEPGHALYPEGITRTEIEDYVAEHPAKKRSPRKVDGDLVGGLVERAGQLLDSRDEERHVRESQAVRAPCTIGECVGARIDSDRERIRFASRAMNRIAAITRANVDHDPAESGGYRGGLTDVYVDDPLAEKSSHGRDATASARRRRLRGRSR